MKKLFVSIIIIAVYIANLSDSFAQNEIDIHGFASTGYMKSDHNNYLVPSEEGSFELNEFAIHFSTTITDKIRIGMQLFSYDLGDTGNNTVKLDWAFLDYQWREVLGIRLGKIKVPYGLYNETQDYDMLRTPILLPQSIYNRYYREVMIGFQSINIYGKISMGTLGRLDYDAIYGTADISTDGEMAKNIVRNALPGSIMEKATMNYGIAGRIKWKTPIKGLILGQTLSKTDMKYEIANASSRFETTIPDSLISLYFVEFSIDRLTFAAEYIDAEADSETEGTIGIVSIPSYELPYHYDGFYGLISYQISDNIESSTYYSVYYDDVDDRDGSKRTDKDFYGWQKDWAISARYDINSSWIVKLEVHFMDGAALAHGLDNPSGIDHQAWTLYAIKTTFSF